MVPWTHLREPCLRWMWTDLIHEFTHFNMVIRLSKVQQWAILLSAFLRCPAAPAVLLILIQVQFSRSDVSPSCQKLSFLTDAQAVETIRKSRGRYASSRFGDSSFWWLSGEVEHIVHLIRWNLNSRLCPCGLIDYGPALGVTHDYLGVNWIRSNCWYNSNPVV